MRRLLLSVALGALAVQAGAQEIAVRSGEHEGFSRLVFAFPAGTEWSLEEQVDGLRLVTAAKTFRYDLSQAFRLIPRTRVTGVTQDGPDASVLITLAPDVHQKSFQLANGSVVIDILDGASAPVVAARDSMPRLPQDEFLDLYWRSAQASRPGGVQKDGATTIKLEDPRVRKAETELLTQLGRAASQGLITLHLPETSLPPAGDVPTADGDLALDSETVIDRDTDVALARPIRDGAGQRCKPDDDFDPKAWAGAGDPATLIAASRRDLVGEFDRPNPEAVQELGRRYVAFGFGAEARALYRSFGLDISQDPGVGVIADLLDDRPIVQDSPVLSMTDCDGKVAIWALLARSDVPAPERVNLDAVMRGFSALPPQLRARFGPLLVEKLIALKAGDRAVAARAAVARIAGQESAPTDLMGADIALAKGADAEAVPLLSRLAEGNSGHSGEAMVKLVEARLAAQETIDQATIDGAGALAHEMHGSELGWRLERVHLLGLGSIGTFDAAFAALDAWPDDEQTELRELTRSDLFGLLQRVPSDGMFLRVYFAQRSRAESADLPTDLQVALSERLSSLGFASEATSVLSPASRRTDQGRIALARAALAASDASAALAYLDGLQGHATDGLRGRALSMIGSHARAQGAFQASGDAQSVAAEAWRGGDWAVVAQDGSEAQRNLLSAYGLIASSNNGAEMLEGPLAQANALLAQSAAERGALERLLQDYAPN